MTGHNHESVLLMEKTISDILKERGVGYGIQFTKKLIERLKQEVLIMDPSYSVTFALEIIGGRFLEAEQKIMLDPEEAYNYACSVIKGRWEQAEPHIMKCPQSSCLYAMYVMNQRWHEAESLIKRDKDSWERYTEWFGISR